MQSPGLRALVALGFSCLLALTAACGGSRQDAMAPSAATLEALRVGSSAPDPAGSIPPSEPPKTTAVSSTDDGSDIIPPFSAAGKDTPKKSGPAKVQKKAGARPKKKG